MALTLALPPSPIAAQSANAAASSPPPRWEIVLRNRAFLIPERVVQGLPMQPTLGVWWRPVRRLQVGFDAQTVDNSGPGRQGNYAVSRTVPGGGSGNFLQEFTLAARGELFASPDGAHQLMVDASVSKAVRSYHAIERGTGATFGGNRRRSVPAAAMAYERRVGGDGRISAGGAIAWLARDDAMYVRAIPGEQRQFGALSGPNVAADLRLAGPLRAWGSAFIPIAGNNTIERASGRPARALAFDAGLRLVLSPFASGELFVSNALGNSGALAMLSDREYRAMGAGLRIYPDARGVPPLPGDVRRDARRSTPPMAVPQLAAPWLTTRAIGARARYGAQGLLASAEWSPVPGVQGGAFLDLLGGTRDEGELGAVIRVLVHEGGSPFVPRIGVLAAGSRTNNPLVNLLAGNWREIDRLGLNKGGFRFGDEDGYEGRLYVVTLALPLEWELPRATRLRVAPTAGYVQRNGLQLSGVAVGVERELSSAVTLAADGGLTFGKGNMLLADRRARGVPWSVGAGWRPAATAGGPLAAVTLEGFVTNRAGDSPFHALRVRAQRGVSAGGGVRLAFP